MILTTNGVYSLKQANDTVSDKTAIFVSGDLGGGVLTVGYKNDFGDFVAFKAGQLAAGDDSVFFHGSSLKPYVKLEDGVNPSVSVQAAGVK